MAGRVINILPKQFFKFNAVANSNTHIDIGPRAILTPDWVSGSLSVRIFALTIPAGATLKILAVNGYIDPSDPANVLLDTNAGRTATVSLTNAIPGGTLQTQALATPIGPMMVVAMELDQGTTVGQVSATLSIDIVGRDA